VELRDLGDRIKRLLETPIPVPSSAVDTIPAAPLDELVASDDDLLVLGPEDLLAAEEPARVQADSSEESLELEELDLETLHGLQDALPPPRPALAPVAEELMESLEPLEPLEPLESFEAGSDLVPADAWAEEAWEKSPPPVPTRAADEMPFLVTADELPDLGDLVAAAEAPTMALESSGPVLEAPRPEPELSLEEELDLGPPPAPTREAPSLLLPAAGLGLAAAAGATAFALHEAKPAPPPLPEPVPTAPPPAAPGSGQALVAALLQDPAALDALARALVERLGDKALKEVAWEVMPELAERLKR
jgi:hypothetical protein